MAIGKRIRFFRNRKGMTQKQLGEILGFLGKTSDVRMAQYESEARTPKQDLVKEMAHIFDVSPRAITVPEIDSYIGLMHTLFALEDMYGLKIGEIDGEVCLRLDKSDCSTKIEKAEVMKTPDGSEPEIYPEFKKELPDLDLTVLGQYEFYDACMAENVVQLAISTGEKRTYANILLTIGCA